MTAGPVLEIRSDIAAALQARGLRAYEDFLAPSGGVVVSEVRDRIVYFFPADGVHLGLYLKVFRRAGGNEPIRQLIGGEWPCSLAEYEQRRLAWLEQNGFRAPRVAAWGARMRGWSEIDSILVTEDLTGLQALDEWLVAARSASNGNTFRESARDLLRRSARTLRALHEKGFDHPFPYLRHFFVPRFGTDTPTTDRVAVIDVHSAWIGSRVSATRRSRALAESFLSSLKSPITQSDRLAFLRAYADGTDRELVNQIFHRFRQKLRRHPNRYQWADEKVRSMPFPASTRLLAGSPR